MRPTIIVFNIFGKTILVSSWVLQNDLINKTTYDWVKSEITFYNEEDAMAFALAFNVKRKLTKIEQMLQNEPG